MKMAWFVLALTFLVPQALGATRTGSSVEQLLVDREKASWIAWQSKDLRFWQRHLSADHVEIDSPTGPQDRNYVLNGIAARKCSVAAYSLDSFSFRPLGHEAAMIVYRATQEFACGDKRIPNTGWVTSIYRRANGQWENVLFEHMLIPPPKPPEQPKS